MEEVKLTPSKFKRIQASYEEAVRERARQIVVMKDELDWSFTKIGEEFKISRQAAERIYKNAKAEEG